MSTVAVATRSGMRKWVIGAVFAGALATVAGAGTFASFSASTSNPNNVFSTGRVQLSNTKQAGTACLSGYTGTGTGSQQSTLDANSNGSCDALIDLALQKPGSIATGKLALANTGDYDGKLQFWVSGAGCSSTTVATPAGSGDLCSKLEVYIQETDSTYTSTTPTCAYPFSATAACDTSWSAAGDALSDLAATATATAPQPSAGMTLNKTATRYYKVSLRFPDGGFDAAGNGNDNAFQNRRASFDLSWRLQEG